MVPIRASCAGASTLLTRFLGGWHPSSSTTHFRPFPVNEPLKGFVRFHLLGQGIKMTNIGAKRTSMRTASTPDFHPKPAN
jgi:hypothetical protein